VGKLVCSIEVVGKLIGRRNHCAQTATLHRAGRSCENTSTTRILGKDATTPTLFICDKGASLFDDLELERSRNREVS
jgi:hypothetical protein